MSKIAFECFLENNWITADEKRNEEKLTEAIEQVMQAHNVECDNAFLKLPEEKHQFILTEARRILKRKNLNSSEQEKEDQDQGSEEIEDKGEPIAAQ